MAQMSIYLNEETLHKIKEAAEKEGVSVSEWVRNRLMESLEDRWPRNYFDLFGSVEEDELTRPRPLPFDRDSDRSSL